MIDYNCYSFIQKEYSDPLFTENLDATYVIYLENNGRLPMVESQLQEYKPTKYAYILVNKGYKNCNKFDIDSPALDLVDCYKTIFIHSKEKGYNNILILEDDFIFSPEIKKDKHKNNVNNFLKTYDSVTNYVYTIGSLPVIFFRHYDFKNYLGSSLGTHAVIYNKNFRERLFSHIDENGFLDKHTVFDWDAYCGNGKYNNKIMYNYPLCYQKFPMTENRKIWGDVSRNNSIFHKMVNRYINYYNLDKEYIEGYNCTYRNSWILLIGIYILVGLTIIIAFRYLLKFIRNLKKD